MSAVSRRELLLSLAAYPLLHALWRTRALGKTRTIVDAWLIDVRERCLDLRRGRITQLEWQQAIARLHARVPLAEILRFIDFDRLIRGLRYTGDVGTIVEVSFPRVEGLPAELEFGHKLFCYKRGAVTPPHVHNNLVSAHWIVRGSVRTRTFDRVRDEPGHIVLKPTRDEITPTGSVVTMSDDRDNGHWFVGNSEYSYSFDIPMGPVKLNKTYPTPAQSYGMIFVDPTLHPNLDGTIAAPVIRFDESLKKFGGNAAAY